MKILTIQDRLRSGGTERQTVLLSNAFAAAGHDVTLLTFRPGGALAGTVNERVMRRVLQPFDLGLDWFAPGLLRASAQVAPDVILCLGRMANCLAGGLQQQRLTPVVATMRTGKKLPWLFRRSLRRCRHVVANGHEAKETLIRDYALPAEKISVIPNALVFPPAAASGDDLSTSRNLLRAAQGATPAAMVLVCVAMFRPEKNQRELIEIAATLPAGLNWQLWLAGDGPARPACERLVAAKGLASQIKFLGFQRDPSPFYAGADAAVHASWSEALSNFLIEAQAHGLPFVAYEAQGIRECGVPGRTGWPIARNHRDEFCQSVVRLAAQSPADRAALAAEARAYARTTFDPTRQVTAYLDLFARLR
ncbi:MAG: glycosyltransferase [Opitutus sp.]|nr:glycosyltransferase [Opitutus sp.]